MVFAWAVAAAVGLPALAYLIADGYLRWNGRRMPRRWNTAMVVFGIPAYVIVAAVFAITG